MTGKAIIGSEGKNTADKVGMASSLACLIHCLLAPFAISLFSEGRVAVEGHVHLSVLDIGMDLVFLSLAGWASYSAARYAPRLYSALLYFSLFLFALGLVSRYLIESDLLVHVGSVGLIVVHLLNYRYGRRVC